MKATLTEKKIANIESRLTPRCLSDYYKWSSGHVGCLVYDGNHLSIIDTPWRKGDEEIIPLHVSEYKLSNDPSSIIANGMVATIYTYLLSADITNDFDVFEQLDETFVEYLRTQYNPLDVLEYWQWNITGTALYAKNKREKDFFQHIYKLVCGYIGKYFNPVQLPDGIISLTPTIVRMQIPSMSEEQIFVTHFPHSLEDRISTASIPMIYMCSSHEWDTERSLCINNQITYQAFGFIATILNQALRANKTYKKRTADPDDMISAEIIDTIQRLSSDIVNTNLSDKVSFIAHRYLNHIDVVLTTISLDKLFRAYCDMLISLWEDVVKVNPFIPDIFRHDGLMLVSLIQYVEQFMFQCSKQTVLWANLNTHQQEVLERYYALLMDFFDKEYHTNIKEVESTGVQNLIIHELSGFMPDTNFLNIYKISDSPTKSGAKFSYIISDDPSEIKAIEDEMELYIQHNKITKLCEFIADKSKFNVPRKLADYIYVEITKRWGTDIPIQKKSFNTTWNRKFNKKEAK